MRSENSTAYVRSAMLRSKEIVSLACLRVLREAWSLANCCSRAAVGKALAESIEDIVGRLSGVVDPGEFTAQDGRVDQGGLGRPDRGERSRIVDRDAAGCIDDTGPEPDGRTVPLADAPDAHHESQAACDSPGLVGMGHHARVAQCRTFNSVFAGERRAQQQLSCLGELPARIQPIGEFTGVPTESASKIAVTPIEADDDIVKRRPHLALRPRPGSAPAPLPLGTPGTRNPPGLARRVG